MDSIRASLALSTQNFHWQIAAMIFAAYVCIDALASLWMLMVNRLKPVRAAAADFFIYLLISFGVINYTRNFLYIIPMALGGSLGTFLMVSWHKRKKHKPLVSKRKHKRIR